jgi:hypothetical protein
VSVEAFEQDLAIGPLMPLTRYGLAIARAAVGDTAAARAHLVAMRFGLANEAGDVGAGARRAFLAGDSAEAQRLGQLAVERAVFDPVPHIVLSRVYSGQVNLSAAAVLEARAAVAFAPGYAGGWRNWSVVQRVNGHFPEALRSLDRYFSMDPSAEAADAEAVGWRTQLRERMPGGIVAQRAMKSSLEAPK